MKDDRVCLEAMLAALRETARVAGTLVDGDEARRIIVDRAYYYLANPDPRHRFLAGDYLDFDSERFLRMKKFLLRLEKLLDFPASASLWVRVKGLEDHVTVACHNGNIHRYYRFGEALRPLEGDMARCLETGEITTVPLEENGGMLTVLAPVRDSLDRAVGLVELSARHPASGGRPPGWN